MPTSEYVCFSGISTKANGAPIESVAAYNATTKDLIAETVPGATGNWVLYLPINTSFYLTYYNTGCQAITHGPYFSGS